MPPFIYRNEANKNPGSNFLMLTLKGTGKNTEAIGAEVTVYYDGKINYQELMPMRGFQSTVDNRLHFGLGTASSADSLVVNWPDGKYSVLQNVAANQFLKLDQKDAVTKTLVSP